MTKSGFQRHILRYQKLSFYLLIASVAFFPILQAILFCIFAFCSVFLLKKSSFSQFRDIILLSMPFLIGFFFLKSTTNYNINLLFRSIIILVFPFLFTLSNLNNKVNIKIFKKLYVYGILSSVVLSLVLSVFKMVNSLDYSELMYYKLSSNFKLHPSYYSLFIILAYEFSSSVLVLTYRKFFVRLLFVIFLILLNSKLAVIIVFTLLIKDLVKRKRKTDFGILIFFLILFMGLYLTKNSRFSDFQNFYQHNSIGVKSENGVSQRIWIWNEIFKQAKSNILFGKGAGSYNLFFSNTIHKNLLKKDVPYSYELAAINISKKNSHNQYLKYLYEYGIIGLIVILMAFVIILIKSFLYKNYDFTLGFVVFLIYLLFENMLDRQMGIYFYATILSSLYFLNQTYQEKSNKKHMLDKIVD